MAYLWLWCLRVFGFLDKICSETSASVSFSHAFQVRCFKSCLKVTCVVPVQKLLPPAFVFSGFCGCVPDVDASSSSVLYVHVDHELSVLAGGIELFPPRCEYSQERQEQGWGEANWIGSTNPSVKASGLHDSESHICLHMLMVATYSVDMCIHNRNLQLCLVQQICRYCFQFH